MTSTELLNDRYRLDTEIGQGGMGMVYRGYDELLEREVAVKVLNEAGLGTEGRARLLREAQTAARLNHPNIATIYDAGEAGGVPFIVMELVEGETLYASRPASIEGIIQIAVQICAALEHAHTNGIIHRDLKPENVMLVHSSQAGSERDTKIKLMDFGLARSVASRMTVAGMVIGTVFYIAPEQALGQEVDGRADLYSLGVILYELVTGRLPFTGDDPLTVISQHIHAQVVPPRAVNPAIPPSLDRLIVQLLSKEPGKRPSSAGEITLTLENLVHEDTPGAATGLSDTQELSMLDRIARGRFVGRGRELAEANGLWQQASAGAGQLLLISGEPGVGKTRLTREIAIQAEISGGTAYLGECYSEGGAPYEPFNQVIRKSLNADALAGLGLQDFVVADLLTLAPSLKSRFPDVPPNPSLDPQAEQHRLFENVVAFFTALSALAPSLLVIEDVHWADSGTLAMLRHLARRTKGRPLMIIATYREVELDQYRPFQNTLLDLNRERLGTRIKLIRFGVDETRKMLETLFAEPISEEFAAGIFRETEGNPFFIEEVCKALVESGKLYYADGEWHRPGMDELEIPQSVRVAIQSRVTNLAEQVQSTLTLAAIFGREFDYATLLSASNGSESSLIDILDTAQHAQLINEISGERGGTFSFAHALIPATLTESLSGLRRRQLHRQAAAAIQQLRPGDLEALAFHFTEGGDLSNGLEYSMRAAEKATRVFARSEALNHYERARELTEAQGHRDRLRTIHEAIGDLQTDSDPSAAVDAYQKALALDPPPDRCTELQVSIGVSYASIGDARGLEYLEEAIEHLDPGTQASALALAHSAIGRFHHYNGQHHKALTYFERGLEIAEPLGDVSVESVIYAYLAGAHQHLSDYERSMEWARRSIALGERENYPPAIALGYEFIAEGCLSIGDWEKGIDAALKNMQVAEQYGLLARHAWADFSLAHLYYGMGELEPAREAGERALELAITIGDLRLAVIAEGQLAHILADVGEGDTARLAAESSLERSESLNQILLSCTSQGAVAYTHLLQSEWQTALEYMDRCACVIAETDSRHVPLFTTPWYAEALLRGGRSAEAKAALDRALSIAQEAPSPFYEARIRMVMANNAATQGEWARAEREFERATAIQTEINSPLELGRTLYYRGQMWRERGENNFAQADLQRAVELFAESKADFWGKQARSSLNK